MISLFIPCLYPLPSDPSRQCIEFSWDDIFEEKIHFSTSATQETSPPLYLLDGLRVTLEKRCHTASEPRTCCRKPGEPATLEKVRSEGDAQDYGLSISVHVDLKSFK